MISTRYDEYKRMQAKGLFSNGSEQRTEEKRMVPPSPKFKPVDNNKKNDPKSNFSGTSNIKAYS